MPQSKSPTPVVTAWGLRGCVKRVSVRPERVEGRTDTHFSDGFLFLPFVVSPACPEIVEGSNHERRLAKNFSHTL